MLLFIPAEREGENCLYEKKSDASFCVHKPNALVQSYELKIIEKCSINKYIKSTKNNDIATAVRLWNGRNMCK